MDPHGVLLPVPPPRVCPQLHAGPACALRKLSSLWTRGRTQTEHVSLQDRPPPRAHGARARGHHDDDCSVHAVTF
jgi:hypothetical protein